MSQILHWMKEEAAVLIPAIIYFCIAFNLIYFTSGLSLRPDDVRYFNYPMVTFFGFIAAKSAMLLRIYYHFIMPIPKNR